jgi:hypothetical protein
MNSSAISVDQSHAFVTTFDLSPTDSGPLDALRFAVKTQSMSLVSKPVAVIRRGVIRIPPR